jgi:glycosyltransferase involved in cell wall biosynthesis
MKRLLITPRFPPACCGVGDFTAHLARAMREAGEDVLVLTEPGAGARPSGLPLVETPLRGWRNLPGVLRAIRSSGARHIQLEYSSYGWGRWGFSFAVNALAFALRLRGYRLTLGLHELYLPFTARPFELLCGLIQRVHLALLFLAASEIETNTPQRVRAVQRWVPWRAHTVRFRPTPSNIPVAPIASEERETVRRKQGAASESVVVAMFGSFHPAKNHEAVIEAVRQLSGRLSLQLWVLGDPQGSAEYVARLRRLAEPLGSAAFWPGLASAEQVSGWLQAADIFVLPQTDGHLTRSGAFMAAAAHGLPVIAVRNDAEQQDFGHREDVYLVERSTAHAFATAIAEVAADAALRTRLGANLRRLYFSRFDWPHLISSQRDVQTIPARLPGAVATPPMKSKG